MCGGGCGDIDYTVGVTDASAGGGDVRNACVDEAVGSAGGDVYVV
jgi:hypothetical protein